ncbi:hypothetical protein L6R52_36905 [Myxococcota bacterium]|nr:hypothetical protein [Myxococcota bacterium]
MLSAALVLGALQLALPSAAQGADAPDKLFTLQGVELRSDERVFVLFAALNGLGYAEETERKGPPLRAPVYHPIRVQVRDALRKADEAGLTAGIRQLFDEQPAEIETYLEAVLAADVGDANLSPQAKKLAASAGPVIDQFRQQAGLVKLFDTLANEQRGHAKELKARLEKSFGDAAKVLGLSYLKAPTSLVVVPNPLDAHGSVRYVRAKDRVYVVVGPGFKTAEKAVLETAMSGALRPTVDAAWTTSSGQKYAKHWETLKNTPKIAGRWTDGRAYLADTLAALFLYRLQAKAEPAKATKEAEEELLEDLNRQGLRWARIVMRALDGYDGGEPLDGALPKLLGKSFP